MPSKLLLDYEQGVHGTFRRVYPDSDFKYAHLGKCMTALSFVPTADVEGLFESLCEEFPEEETSGANFTKITFLQFYTVTFLHFFTSTFLHQCNYVSFV